MFSLVEAVSESCFKKLDLNILIIGVDGAGKTCALEAAKHAFSPSPKAPCFEKVTSTVGLNIAKLEILGCRVMCWDLGGAVAMRDIWERYYSETHAWIFVVDACDASRFDEAAAAFAAAWESADLADAPCLIMANKHDMPGASDVEEIRRVFEIRAREQLREVRVQPTSATTLDKSVRDGILWLVRQSKLAGPRMAGE